MNDRREDVEEDLRRHYRAVDPGEAPATLRRAIDAIPQTAPPTAPRTRPLFGNFLGLAAALILLVVGYQTLRPAPNGGSGPTSLPSAAASFAPGATSALATTFNPSIEGPGIVGPSSTSGQWLLVVLSAGSLATLGLVLRRRRPLAAVAAALAAGLVGYGLVAAFAPIDLRTQGWGTGIGVVLADKPPGAREDIFYVVAKPDEPFSFAVFLAHPAGPVPFTVDGVVVSNELVAPKIVAVWRDAAPNGGAIGPSAPFQGTDLSTLNGDTIWLVGRTGPCALGHAPTVENSMTGLHPVKVRVSVLGWPRDVELAGVPAIWEPDALGCSPVSGSATP